MNPSFKNFCKIPPYDIILRDAIKGKEVQKAIHLISHGANLNGQYPDDWNTPLQVAIKEGWDEQMIQQLLSCNPDYGLVNADDLTAAELALEQGMRSIAQQLVEAEARQFRTPEEACYEMMKRNSVEAMAMLLDCLPLPSQELVDCLTKAWRRLEVMNVQLGSDVEALVHLRVIRHDYEKVLYTKFEGTKEDERIRLMMNDISQFVDKFDTGLFDDISDDFLTRLRNILKQLYVAKDGIKWFPATKLEFCIAIYIAIFDRAPELDLFRLIVHKVMIIQFLKQFQSVYDNPNNGLDARMTGALLFELVKAVLINRNRKCKHIINAWTPSIGCMYKFKEKVMIRNFIVKNFNNDNLSVDLYDDVSPNNKKKFKTKSIEINNTFDSKVFKHKYKILCKTYFKLKQTYSLDKVNKCLTVVKSIDLNCKPLGSRFKVSILAMQRAIQIVGETLKSTQLSPNISKGLRSCLEVGAPGTILTRITELRELFSHNYSWTKHSIYERLNWNDPKLIELYKSVQADLLKLRPMLVNIYENHKQRSFKSFLGTVLQLSTADEVRSFAMECSKNIPWNIQLEHDADDVNQLDEILKRFEASCRERNLQEHYDTVAQVRSELSAYKHMFESTEWEKLNDLFASSIENLITIEPLEYQRNIARWHLKRLSPAYNGNEYGPISILHRFILPQLLPILDFNLKDTNFAKSIIGPFLNLESSTAIDSYCTALSEISKRDVINLLQISRLQLKVDKHQQEDLTELLKPYCKKVFSIDGKYSTVNKFCKENRVNYSKQLLGQSRATDVQCFQNIFKDLVEQVGDILSFSEEVAETEFASMVDSYEINQCEIMAAEMILLEILGILCERRILPDFRASMINQRPVVTGRNLRNYLAHDNLVYDANCGNRNSTGTVLYNAYSVYHYLRVNIYDQQQHHGSVVEPIDSLDLIQTVQIKKAFVLAVEQGQFEKIDFRTIESKLRTEKNSTILEVVALKQSKEFLRFLLGDSLRMKPLMDILICKSPNQRHSFNVFNLSIRELMLYESLPSDLNAYFSTSLNCLQDLKGSAFSNESLLNAISRRSEPFALSIINNPFLYGSSRKHNSSGTVVTLSVAAKLPAVVRRLCEVDPEMTMQTDSPKHSAFDVALMTGSFEMVDVLLEFKIQVNSASLIDAMRFGMMYLFNADLPKDATLLNGLLLAAAEANNLEVLSRVLPLIDTKESIHQALCGAILHSNFGAVRKILQHNPDVINEFENNASIIACACDSAKMINLLLEYGADCNLPTAKPALHFAIDHAKRSIFKIFLQQGKINKKLKATLFERCLQASKPKMALMTYRANYPYTLPAKNFASLQKLLPKMYNTNPAVLDRLNGNLLALAILHGMHAFVKHIFYAVYPRMSQHELARCLICAIKAHDVSMVQFLLDQGCDVNQADSNGLTPLALTAALGSEVILETLLQKGANPDLESVAYCQTMTIAWKHENVSFEQFGGQRSVTYPLIIALAEKFNAIAVKLIQHGAATEIYDCFGFSPLVVAIAFGDYRLVTMLIESGANVRYAKDFIRPQRCKASVLHTVAHNGHLEVFKLLIELHGFDPTVTDPEGNTTLHTAVKRQQAAIVEYLLESQCWNVANNNGQTPITLAFTHLDENVFFLTQSKLKDSSDVHSFRSSSGRSLLHMAVFQENIPLVHALLNVFNFDLNCEDTEGFTPIHYAIYVGNLELIKMFMKSGATFFFTQHNQTQINTQVGMWLIRKFDVLRLFLNDPDTVDARQPYHSIYLYLLQYSISLENYASCKLLLSCKELDPNIVDQYGISTLHLAIKASSVRIAALLLSRGLFIDQLNVKNETPLMVALDMNDGRMAHYLFGKGASKSVLINHHRFASNPTKTLLHWFAEQGKLNALCFLIKRKIFSFIVKDADGWTIGHYAAANNQQHVIDYLALMRFPFDDTDIEGRSCLVCAIQGGHLDLAEKLSIMDCSLSLVQQYNEKKSLLKNAIKNRQKDMVQFLVEKCCLEC